MGEADLYAALAGINRHWETGEVSPVVRKHPAQRKSYYPFRRRILDLPFLVLAGPRQVGKTTVMGHLMAHLLEGGVPRRHVVYASLDHPLVQEHLGGSLQPLLDLVERRLLGAPLEEAERPVYLFLDEIHALEHWDRELKALYDRYHPWVRVMASGSSAAALHNPHERGGTGRWEDHRLLPLKVREVVEAMLPEVFRDDARPVWERARDAREALKAMASEHDQAALRPVIEQVHAAAAAHLPSVHAAFDRYLVRGGYPGAYHAPTDAAALLFAETTLDTATSLDLKMFAGIRKVGLFRAFVARLALDHGGKFVAQNHTDLGISKNVPAQWKAVAEELYLVHQLPVVNGRLQPDPRKTDKAYMQDPGIRAYLSAQTTLADLERTGALGAVVEGVLFDHLQRLQHGVHGVGGQPLGYCPTPEVDFLVRLKGVWLAIESKYGDVPASAVQRLERMWADRDDVVRIIASRDILDLGGRVWVVPAWLLCYLC